MILCVGQPRPGGSAVKTTSAATRRPSQADRAARNITQQLSPPILQRLGLLPALEWLGEGAGGKGLADWDISRDAPYFGIPIPDAPGNSRR